jgi:hypothetical protein
MGVYVSADLRGRVQMARFEELRGMALKKNEAFNELAMECNAFGRKLVHGLRKYLDAPDKAILCYEVDRQYQQVGEPSLFVNLCFCFDAFWYFSLEITFSSDTEVAGTPVSYLCLGVLVGVMKVGSGFKVRMPDKDLQIDDEAGQAAFYDWIFNSLKESLSRPWTQPQNKLGFVTP